MTDPTYVPPSINTFFGATIASTVTTPLHSWTADASGLLHTTTDLKSEWMADYSTMMSGDPSTLTFIQRLEGNAEAVFENTALKNLSTADQARDREDVQREFDAIAGAMQQLGMNGKAALTTQDYLNITNTIQKSDTLEELVFQGHGLNNPSVPRYNGYTNDFQHNVDNTTLYIGGGLDTNQNALTDFFDDVVLSHLGFPVVEQNGHLEQLNQNGAAEDTLTDATGALDSAGATRVFTAADFSATPGTASSTPAAPPPTPVSAPAAGTITTLFGATIASSMTVNGHAWTADATGKFITAADLATEWKTYYTLMQNGQGGSLTGIQRLEGNAEAVFENTGLANLTASKLAVDRMDAQREFDAVAAEEAQLGISATAPLTTATYLALEQGLRNNAALEELAIQGHGLNSPPSSRYNGYTNDFQNNVDNRTLYVGPGQDSGERAIADFFDDAVLSHLPFPSVAQGGELEQLNQNANAESTVQAAVEELNATMFTQVLGKPDFNIPGTQPVGAGTGYELTPGTTITFFGAQIASSMSAGAHVWTIGTDGRFHTTTNLMTEWQGYYQQMLSGNGATLTWIQRLEGNAEAVFENTTLKSVSAAKQQSFREDLQREFDAIAVEMTKLGLGGTLLTTQDYLNIGNALQSDAALEELAMQGHGLNSAPSAKYYGYTTDFQNNSDNTTYYVGGGLDNGETAIPNFLDDVVMSHLPFPVISQNGAPEQLNQNANSEDLLTSSVNAFNDAMFRRVYVAGDFSTNAATVGPVVYVSAAAQAATAPALPTPGPGQMYNDMGGIVPTTIVANGDTWVADAAGRYQTTTDLDLQFYNAYQTALAGGPLTLTQHWEANAEAVFENTGLKTISDGMGQTDRSDVKRVIDAVVTIMQQLGLGGAPLTAANYLAIEHALQGNAALQELAIQGEGLYYPYVAGQTKYNGYTQDFSWWDSHTLYVGGGQGTGERAVGDFFADSVLGDWTFPVVAQNGEIKQLNVNGNADQTLAAAVSAANATLFSRIYKAADFMTPGAMPPPPAPVPPATIVGLYGDTLAGTIVANGHTWTVDANGLYHTATNLDMEWRTDYQIMLSGHGDTLTATQRMEANAEAVFENTNINTMWMGAAKEAAYREDVQRVIDAIAEAMKTDQALYAIDPAKPFTEATYVKLDETLRANPALLELATQGAGVQSPPSARYYGAYRDIIGGADWSTYYVGGGADNGRLADPYFFADNVLSFLPAAVAFENGHWQQLNQNGDAVMTAQQAAANLNEFLYRRVLVASDFSTTATAVGQVVLLPQAAASGAAAISSIVAPAGFIVALDGTIISATMTVNGHTWVADVNGEFQTSANLAAEWQGYYQTLLANPNAPLTASQRQEANAEAVFEATVLKNASSGVQAAYRADMQREIDAIAAATAINATTLGINPQAALLQGSYLALERTLQSNSPLEELALQGHGLAAPPSIRYAGYQNDIAKLSSSVKYIGTGIDANTNALSVFLGDNILSNTPFAVVWKGGRLVQLNSAGGVDMVLANAVTAVNDAWHNRVYKRTDFH